MDIKLEDHGLMILSLLKKHAPKMTLHEAYDLAERLQRDRNDLVLYGFLICELYKLLGANESGNVTKEMAKKFKDLPAESDVFKILNLTSYVYACHAVGISDITHENGKKRILEKYKKYSNSDEKWYRDMILDSFKDKD